MKTFTKIMLILSGVFGTIGVICIVVAFAMGLTTTTLWDMVENGQFSFDLSDIPLGSSVVTGTEQGEYIYETCDSMEIEFDAGLLEVYYDDVEEIQVKWLNIENLEAEVKKGTLIIGKKSGINVTISNNEERKLTVILPRNMQFESVELEVGAGQAVVTGLITQKLDVEVGAGQAEVELSGKQEDYNYRIECGVGNVVVGKNSYVGLGAEQSVTNEGATKEINIECGIGQAEINFME